MGNGMVIDLEHLVGEMQRLIDKGIAITPAHLKISEKAVICMPYHKMLDCLEEDRLGDAKFGSTRRGIGPVYGDKYMKKIIRMCDLFESEEYIKKRLAGILEWRNLMIHNGYGAEPVTTDDMYAWLRTYGDKPVSYTHLTLPTKRIV